MNPSTDPRLDAFDATKAQTATRSRPDPWHSSAIAENFASNLEGDNDCNNFADCKKLLEDGKTIHYRGASSMFEKWNKMEPGTGVYDVWAYGADGKSANVEGAAQISIG